MKKKLNLFLIFCLVSFLSCGENKQADNLILSETTQPSAYEMMSVAFEGNPSIEQIKPILEEVMSSYNLEVNEENLKKVASVLVSLRKESKVGVTEMEILKDIYQNGIDNTTFQSQAALSATTLELSK